MITVEPQSIYIIERKTIANPWDKDQRCKWVRLDANYTHNKEVALRRSARSGNWRVVEFIRREVVHE